MEPKGLLLATLIIGLMVFAMSIDHATSETPNRPKDSDTYDGKGKSRKNQGT